MHFEYEITVDDYVAGQVLYHRRSAGRRHLQRAISLCLVGSFLIAVAWNERALKDVLVLLAIVGALCIYAGIASFFPAVHFRRAYPKLEMAGRRFKADMCEEGLEVTDDVCTWRVRWPGVRFKGENERIFMLYAANTIFMFGKKYLNSEQQIELRKLSGLESVK